MESGGGNGRWEVSRLETHGPAITPEDVWNAAIRAGADPARMALSLCHVLGEVAHAGTAGEDDDPVPVRFTVATGDVVVYDATLHNPFK
jgi:hypothetical protein